jgi:hypothetical protein
VKENGSLKSPRIPFVFQMGYPNHAQWSKGVFFIIKLKTLNLQQFYDWICCYFEIHFHLGGGATKVIKLCVLHCLHP